MHFTQNNLYDDYFVARERELLFIYKNSGVSMGVETRLGHPIKGNKWWNVADENGREYKIISCKNLLGPNQNL